MSATPEHSGAEVVLISSTTSVADTIDSTSTTRKVLEGNTVELAEGNNYIAVQVTAADGTSANRDNYMIQVTRASSNFSDSADLVGLTITGGSGIPAGGNITLVPPARGATNYMAFVPFGVDNDGNADGNQVAVTATGFGDATDTASLDKANVRVTAETIGPDTEAGNLSNVSTHAVTLGTGSTVITIEVESADASVEKTYTLTVRRAALNGLDDARLSSLTVGGRSVNLKGFTPLARDGTHAVQYMARIPNTASSIQVSATPMDSGSDGAVVVIKTADTPANAVANPGATASTVVPGGNVPLNEGETKTIAVQVTAANGETELNYILSAMRVFQGASDVADLGTLEIAAEDSATDGAAHATITFGLTPGFDADTTSYMASVPNDVDGSAAATDTNNDTIVVTATPPAGGTVRVTSDNDDFVSSTGNAYTVELVEGANVITIVAEAADASAMKTYTLTVRRAAATSSDDASLSELVLHAPGDSTMVYETSTKLMPYFTGAFDSVGASTAGNIIYAGVPNTVEQVQITAAPAHSGATVAIKTFRAGTAGTLADADVNSAEVDADGMVDVIVGLNNHILVEVMAENGVATSTYYVELSRARANASDNAKLLPSFGISAGTLAPAFDEDTMAYTAEVENSVKEITVTAANGSQRTTTAPAAGGAFVRIMSGMGDAGSSEMMTDTNVSFMQTVELMVGVNVITIMVTAADYSAMNTYTVTITRAADAMDATLSSLSLKHLPMDMMEGVAIDLMPAFDSGTMTYTADAGSAEAITVTPKTRNSDASVSVTVNGIAATKTDIPMYWDMLGCPAMNDSVRAYDDHSHPDDATSPYCTTYNADATHPGLMGDAKDVVDRTFANYYDIPLSVGDNAVAVMVTSGRRDRDRDLHRNGDP